MLILKDFVCTGRVPAKGDLAVVQRAFRGPLAKLGGGYLRGGSGGLATGLESPSLGILAEACAVCCRLECSASPRGYYG